MNVLIIDDEPLVLRTLQRYIERRGDASLVANNGRSGLQIFREHPVDLVITDIRMPDLDGLQVLHAIHQESADTPVIIVTAYADIDLAIRAVNEGAFAFLKKPIPPRELDGRIDEAVKVLEARRQKRNQLEKLARTTLEQERRLEQEKAFSTAILHHIPFPVCLVDPNHRVHMANPAFTRQIVDGDAPVEGQLLEELVGTLDTGPVPIDHLFTPILQEGEAPEIVVEVSGLGPRQEEEPRYYNITGFPVGESDPHLPRRLTCLFFQDVTLRTRLEREQQLRSWCLRRAYEFRESTAPLVHSAELLEDMTGQLATALKRFNSIAVRLSYQNQSCVRGDEKVGSTPYLSAPLFFDGEEKGRLELFSPAPESIEIQREFAQSLVEIITRRIETRQLQLRVLQTSQLHALGEMAAGVAHELNQPLSGIRTFAEDLLISLRNGLQVPADEVAETFADIVDQVDRMSVIINHLRTFARDSSEEEAIDFTIDRTIDNVLKLVGTQLKVHGIDLQMRIAKDLPRCHGWPQQLEQVLLNLIANARQAMDEHAAKVRESNPTWRAILDLDVSLDAAGNLLRIAVSDTGGGIPPDIVERVFEPFFTTKEAGEGTGLGLSISYSIVQKHGGYIELDNRPGKGVTFSVLLPRAPRETDPS